VYLKARRITNISTFMFVFRFFCADMAPGKFHSMCVAWSQIRSVAHCMVHEAAHRSGAYEAPNGFNRGYPRLEATTMPIHTRSLQLSVRFFLGNGYLSYIFTLILKTLVEGNKRYLEGGLQLNCPSNMLWIAPESSDITTIKNGGCWCYWEHCPDN
jgi:hypothetical protein